MKRINPSRRTFLQAAGLGATSVVTSSYGATGQSTFSPLFVVSPGSHAEYSFSVSGDLERGERFDPDTSDWIERNKAGGAVDEGGADNFQFSGEITDFRHEGPIHLWVDGNRVDPNFPNALVKEIVGRGELAL